MLAELHGRLGDHPTCLRLIEGAHREMQQTEQHLWHSDLCRIEGELRHHAGAPDVQVEACFVEAIEWARRQEAKSFELRATTSLARLWRDQRRYGDARKLLAPICAWFTEGFDMPDLVEALELLTQLDHTSSTVNLAASM